MKLNGSLFGGIYTTDGSYISNNQMYSTVSNIWNIYILDRIHFWYVHVFDNSIYLIYYMSNNFICLIDTYVW